MDEDQVDELRERSKDDRAIIVGSEVRMLCGEIDRLRAQLAQAAKKLSGLEGPCLCDGCMIEMPRVAREVAAARALLRQVYLAEFGREDWPTLAEVEAITGRLEDIGTDHFLRKAP